MHAERRSPVVFLRGKIIPVLSLVVFAASAVELAVSRAVSGDFEPNQVFCRFYLCEERVPLADAYGQQLQGTKASLKTAADILLDSIIRDPASAYRWVDLGEVLGEAGDIDRGLYCMTRALEIGGVSADVAMAAGDFNLRYGDRRRGLAYLRRTLQLTPVFNREVFSYFAARNVSLEESLKYGLPEEKLPAQAYLSYLIEQNDVGGAGKVWGWMASRGFIDEKSAITYCNFLFAQKRFAEAAEAWASQVRKRSPEYRRSEYLFNGDFAAETLSTALVTTAIFDWKITPLKHVSVSRECDAECSLRVQFDGSANVDFNNVLQATVLPPGKYRFTASVRGEDLTTDQGVSIRIADGASAARLNVESAPLLGTADWQSVTIDFAVTPATKYLEVSLRRRPSLRFDNKIAGSAWIRRASLVRAQ